MASDRTDFNRSVVCGISDIGRIADGVAVGWPRLGIEIHFPLAVVGVKRWVDRESSTGIAEFLCDVTSRQSALDCIGCWTINDGGGGVDFWTDVFDERPGGSVCAGYRSGGVAAAQLGVPYTLVTGIPLPEQFIDNALATPQAVLCSEKFERFEAIFSGAGDTLSAALTALLANGHDLQAATAEALAYLDQSLSAGFHPGMGHTVPDRMFWAQAGDSAEDEAPEDAPTTDDADLKISTQRSFFDMPPYGTTKH